MKNVLMIALLVSAMSSCKKSTSDATTPTPIDTLATKPFIQLNAGSYWKFAHLSGTDSASASKDTFKLTVQNADTLINTYSYKMLSDSAKKYVFYYRTVADSNFRRGLFTNIGGGVIPDLEEKYLVNSVVVGGIWSQAFSFKVVTPYPATVSAVNNYTIKSLDDTLTVAGKLYSHVAKVHLDMNIISPLTALAGTGDFYYARGIGPIKYTLSVNFLTAQVYENAALLSYYVK
ncbi:hypothetical protein [Parasediminibacterium sp. JCM 36343]|uniref:hypothetical protein n=1 Tax=Parasediminibacterium sp. JCM 36343 TaxID=3374279 RepID=UPI00397AEC48